jgi:hypothetical protein
MPKYICGGCKVTVHSSEIHTDDVYCHRCEISSEPKSLFSVTISEHERQSLQKKLEGKNDYRKTSYRKKEDMAKEKVKENATPLPV